MQDIICVVRQEAMDMNLCISDNLNLLRQKHGYTLEALAEIISVSRQTIAKWEAGDSYPDIINSVKLATLYKISLDELVNKPLKDIMNDAFTMKEGRIGGVVEISDEGTIPMPDIVMEMFDIQRGDKLLLLADKKQGIALVKCSHF